VSQQSCFSIPTSPKLSRSRKECGGVGATEYFGDFLVSQELYLSGFRQILLKIAKPQLAVQR